MADIKKELNDIKNAVYGREVRGSIHDGINKINKESEGSRQIATNTEQRQDAVEQQFNNLLSEWSDERPIDNAETIAARTNTKESKTYENLGKRLDEEYGKVKTQLAETEQDVIELQTIKADKTEVDSLVSHKADITYVDDKIANLDGLEFKGAFDTLADLENAYPNGASGLFVVHADNHWYYFDFDNEKWKKGNELETTPWAEFMTTDGEEWVI